MRAGVSCGKVRVQRSPETGVVVMITPAAAHPTGATIPARRPERATQIRWYTLAQRRDQEQLAAATNREWSRNAAHRAGLPSILLIGPIAESY
jgi:hypothetical protein